MDVNAIKAKYDEGRPIMRIEVKELLDAMKELQSYRDLATLEQVQAWAKAEKEG